MKKLLGLALVVALGVFAYIPRDAPAAQVEPAAAPGLVTVVVEPEDSFTQCPNCCEFSEEGRCTICRRVCP
jgi:hypothetical protein